MLRKPIAAIGAILFMLLLLAPGASAQGLDERGLLGLGQCETSDTGLAPVYTQAYGLGLFHGAHQYLEATWRAAAIHAGFPQWADTLPGEVPAEVQDAVTVSHWANSDPATQWPRCFDDALRAMGFHAPCLPRNVVPCVAAEQAAETNPVAVLALTGPWGPLAPLGLTLVGMGAGLAGCMRCQLNRKGE